MHASTLTFTRPHYQVAARAAQEALGDITMARFVKGSTQLSRDIAPILPGDAPNVTMLLDTCSPLIWQHGLDWYQELNAYARDLAKAGGYTMGQVADVFACYSINNQWPSTIAATERAVLEGYRLGLINRKHGMDVPYWVTQILDTGATLDSLVGTGARKIRTFSRNIQLRDGVTVDRWIYKAYGKPNDIAWYTWIARRITHTAASYGILDYQLQAIIWLAVAVADGKKLPNYVARATTVQSRDKAARALRMVSVA